MTMKLAPASATRVILDALARGPVNRRDMVEIARRLASTEHAGDVALLRLQEYGFVVCEYRLTATGAKVLREVKR